MKYLAYGSLAVLSMTVLYTLTLAITSNPNIQAGAANVLAVSAPLEVDKTTHEYGDLDMYGGKAISQFTLTNSGVEAITVNKIFTSCMCTTATVDGQSFGMHGNPNTAITIEPNSFKNVTVAFDPLAHGDNDGALGPITRQVFIATNSTVTPEIELKLTGNVIRK